MTALSIVLFILQGCAVRKDVVQATDIFKEKRLEARVTFLYQACRFGVVEPCGCSANPFGGIDREANAVGKIRNEEKLVWVVDAGNLFAPKVLKAGLRHHRDKAIAIVEMLNHIGLEVFSPGPTDYQLGISFLKELEVKSKFTYVSSNVTTPDGKPLFAPYWIQEKGGIIFAFLAITPKHHNPRADLRVIEAGEALRIWLPEARAKSDVVVVLSQLPFEENEKLMSRFSGLHVVFGADPNFMYNDPYRITKHTILVDPDGDGILIGRLDLDLTLPFQGFYSPAEVEKNRRRVAYWEKKLSHNPNNKLAAEMLTQVKSENYLEPVAGGSLYLGELIRLDEKRFGKKNRVSEMMAKLKEKTRKKVFINQPIPGSILK